MINEINLIKCIMFKKEYLIKTNKDVEYYINSMTASYKSIITLLRTLNKNSTDVARNLVSLHCDYVDIRSDLYQMRHIIDYALRKNQLLSSTIKVNFDETQLINNLLNQTVDTMLHIKNIVPVTKYSYKEFETAYAVIDTFTTHGHYLSRLAHNKNEYHVKNVLLYIRHVYKTLSKVYDRSILQMLRSYPLNKVES